MWTCLNEKPGRSRLGPPRVGIAQGLQQCLRPARDFTPSQRRLPAAWIEPLSSRYQSKYGRSSTGGGGETLGSSKTARTQDTLREVVIPRCSKHSSSGSAVTTEPRRSIMRRAAASMASRAASGVPMAWLCRPQRPSVDGSYPNTNMAIDVLLKIHQCEPAVLVRGAGDGATNAKAATKRPAAEAFASVKCAAQRRPPAPPVRASARHPPAERDLALADQLQDAAGPEKVRQITASATADCTQETHENKHNN